MTWSAEQVEFMQLALEVAERGRGRVKPNPLVGCVLVKNGEVIAEGWHDHLGGLHAEQMAIHDAEEKDTIPTVLWPILPWSLATILEELHPVLRLFFGQE